MAAYTRQSTFSDGDTISASLFNNEYDAIAATFVNTSGHKHDGTTGEGPVIGLIGDAGVATPLNKVLIDSSNNHIEFYVDVSSAAVQQMHLEDGKLLPNVDSDIDLGSSTKYFANGYIDAITTTGNVTVGGNLTVTGTTTFNGGTINLGDAATDNVAFNGTITTNLIFEGSTADAHETTLAPGNPGSDITLTLPSSATDTLVGRATTDTLTNKTLTSPKINEDVVVTSTATELNLLDGVTATTSELNILDGVTSTASELNILDGVTSTASELNILDGVTSTATELNILDGVTSTTSELNILDGVTSTAAELNALDGITAVVGELNALDIGSTAIGTAVASKAVILDANKDYTGIRNLTVTGELDGASLDIEGDADINGTLEADAITIAGTALDTHIAGVTVTNATTATNANHISVADNESTNENNLITFIEDASATGNVGLESDGDFYYNPSTGTVTATGFAGALTGNASTATALATARTIHGVSFDGSGNIDLSEVIQDTVGAMFDGNTETDITATYQDADGTIDLVVSGSSVGGSTGIDFNDGVKTRYGTGNDLEVYHDGTNGYITNSDGALKLATETSGIAVTIGHATSEVTVADNLTVTGNLTVSGTTTTVSSTTVEVADAMLKLAKDQGTSADAVDFGFYGKYGVGGTAKYAGIFRDQSATGTPFTFFDTLEADPGTTVNTGGTGYDLADISAGGATFADSVTITGDLTISGDDITMGTNTSGHIMVADGTNFNPVAVSGDVTISNAGAVTIASTAVETGMIAADAITGAKIADDAVDSEHYTDGSIDTAHIADLNVTTAKIAADAITGAKIADDAIDSEHYVDGSIDTAHIGDDNVTQAKIADDAVGADQLAASAVVTASMVDDAVTQAKIADEAVDEARLQISNAGSNGQYLQKQSGNTGGLTWADASSVGGATGVDFNDNVKARFGTTDNDLEIYHDGSNSIIADTGTGGLQILSNAFKVMNAAGDENQVIGTEDAAVELYHNGTKKLETASGGVTITGTATATTFDGLLDTGAALKVGAWYNDNGTSAKGRFWFSDGGTTQINTAADIDFSYETTNKARIESDGDFICVGNITAYGSLSDEKLKENIEIIPDALDKVCQLKGVTFDYKKDGKRSTGLIAQDLQKVLPEVVYETKDINNENESYLAVNYENTIGLLVEAIKELKAEVKELKEAK